VDVHKDVFLSVSLVTVVLVDTGCLC